MYVCLCKGISDRTIQQAVINGRGSLKELKANFGLGAQCGRCTSHAREVIQAACVQLAPGTVTDTLEKVCYT